MTARELTKAAYAVIGLINENGEPSGDTDDLSARALNLINILLAENAELDCRIRRTEHTVKSIGTLEDELDLCEIVSNGVMPYGLAFMLTLGEDDSLAEALRVRYAEARKNALKFGKAKAEPITEVYR